MDVAQRLSDVGEQEGVDGRVVVRAEEVDGPPLPPLAACVVGNVVVGGGRRRRIGLEESAFQGRVVIVRNLHRAEDVHPPGVAPTRSAPTRQVG